MSPHSQQHLGSSGRFQTRQLYSQMAGSAVDTPGSPVFKNYSGTEIKKKQSLMSLLVLTRPQEPCRSAAQLVR
jgi:hypothetical protein